MNGLVGWLGGVLFPALLVAGSLGLAAWEIRAHLLLRTLDLPSPAPRGRLARRLVGAGMMAFIGVWIYGGLNLLQVQRSLAVEQAKYWNVCVVVVLVCLALALWDALEGMRHLRRELEKDLESSSRSLRGRPGKKKE